MSDHTQHNTSTLSEKLNAFFSRHRIALIVFAVVLIVGIIASVAIAQVLNARAERSAQAAEEIERLWEEWTALQPLPTEETPEELGEDARAIETELREKIAETTETFGNAYGAIRAQLVLGLLEWDLDNTEEARAIFESVATSEEGTYLEPIALANAAAAAEESGDTEGAISLYEKIVALDDVPNLERSHALFSLGRLSEAGESYEQALTYYNQLIDEHETGNWTNLGRNRIIWLTSQGLVGRED